MSDIEMDGAGLDRKTTFELLAMQHFAEDASSSWKDVVSDNVQAWDMFQYDPTPQVQGKEGVTSSIGGWWSILLIILMIYYVIDTSLLFARRENPNTVQNILPSDPNDIIRFDYATVFSVDGTAIVDPTIYSFKFEQSVQTDTKTRWELNTTSCYLSDTFPEAVCPYDVLAGDVLAGVAQGDFLSLPFQYVRIEVLSCINGSSVYDNGTAVVCKSEEELLYYRRRGVVNVGAHVGPPGERKWTDSFFNFEEGYSIMVNLYFTYNTWSSYRKVWFGYEEIPILDYVELDSVLLYKEYADSVEDRWMGIYLRMASEKKVTSEYFDSILDLLSSLGGLWATLVGSGFACKYYNRKLFWNAREWDLGDISRNCKVEVSLTPLGTSSAQVAT